MLTLEGKNALVCAGSSGIGRGIVNILSEYGANVTTFSRNIEKLNIVKKEVKEKTGKDINIIRGDLSKNKDIVEVVESAHEAFGGIDILVMNYGDPKVDKFINISDDEWKYSIDMMLLSTINLIRMGIQDMIKKNNGRIVLVTSMTTKNPLRNFSISNTLRSGIVALGKTLSIELAENNITVNSISQGFFYTDRLKNIIKRNSDELKITIEEATKNIENEIPMKRFGNPEEIGNLVAFLCSNLASYITGDNIQIDGGVVKSI